MEMFHKHLTEILAFNFSFIEVSINYSILLYTMKTSEFWIGMLNVWMMEVEKDCSFMLTQDKNQEEEAEEGIECI